jgi:hypothetical protein
MIGLLNRNKGIPLLAKAERPVCRRFLTYIKKALVMTHDHLGFQLVDQVDRQHRPG